MTVEQLPKQQGIYKIIFPNNKVYIGLSKNISHRVKEHIKRDYTEHPDLLISKAIYKYGVSDVEVLELLPDATRAELQEKEKYWIQYYNATNIDYGYNMSVGGDGADAGWDNHQAKLTKEQLFEIYDLLQNSTLTYEEIAAKYNLVRASITRINSGIHYFQPNIKYPIRKERLEHYGLQNKNGSFYGKEKELEELVKDLRDTNILIEDLAKKYQVSISVISQINRGKLYQNDKYTYPLRPKNRTFKRIFSDEEMLYIKTALESPSTSMTQIAKELKCDRKVIAAINNGTRQKQDNWNYPLRKIPMKTGPKS